MPNSLLKGLGGLATAYGSSTGGPEKTNLSGEPPPLPLSILLSMGLSTLILASWVMSPSTLVSLCRFFSGGSNAVNSSHAWKTSTKKAGRLVLLRLAAVVVLSFLASPAWADCYWPDGTENDVYEPCYEGRREADFGLCCRPGDVCLSGGICENSTAQVYYRGGCAYTQWAKGADCPDFCLNEIGIEQHSDMGMRPCPEDSSEWYCLDDTARQANCHNGNFIITLGTTPVALTTVNVKPKTTSEAPTVTATTKPTSGLPSSATTALSTTGFDANSTATSGPPGVVAPSATSTPSNTTGPDTGPGTDANYKSAVVPLAVGLSVGAAFALLTGFMGFRMWRQRKQTKALALAESPPLRGLSDDHLGLDPSLPRLLFRSGSLRQQQEPVEVPADPVSAASASAFRNNGSSSNGSNNHTTRFNVDTVAMHNIPHSPSAGWENQNGGGEPYRPNQTREIPYDGRRFAPYYGAPTAELNGYSELPG